MTVTLSYESQEVYVGVELKFLAFSTPLLDGIGHIFVPTDLPSGNSPRYPLSRRLGSAPSRLGLLETTNHLPLSGSEPHFLGRPARSPVTTPNTPSRF
jgi:hypothetical protein